MRKPHLLVVALLSAMPLAVTSMQRRSPTLASPASPGSATAGAVVAANAFLATLNDAERARALYSFDSPQKTNWSNLPSGIYQRNSLRLGDLTAAQHGAALALVASVLSREGYQKVTDIMNADEVLQNAGGGRTGGRPGGAGRPAGPGDGRAGGAAGNPGGPGSLGGPGGTPQAAPPTGRGGGIRFGLTEFYLAVLGTPSTSTPWMVQFGGHHLAINVTMVGRNNVLTPSLPAAQPATYTLNGQSIRPLGDENDKGFALISALDAGQKQQAILNYKVNDLVLGAGQDGKVIQPEGILASALTASQRAMLLDLVHEWVGILNDEGAAAKMAEITANLPRTYFAWSGSTVNGSLAYFRVQGPTLVIEYAPQQGDLSHIHTIYRDPVNDYGAKLVTP